MSLSVTAVVQAAGGETEAAVVARAARLLGVGLRFGDEVAYASDVLEVLAAAYVGLVLVEGPPGAPTGDPERPDTVEVCASRVWSQTPLLRSATERVLTHGELVSWASGANRGNGGDPWWPRPLSDALRPLFASAGGEDGTKGRPSLPPTVTK